ncbi:MAG: B12-binding domain-containing radical SAM protein [Promethearchaeota archaeon]
MGIDILLVDCLTAGEGTRKFTRDFIGSGPRYVAGFIETNSNHKFQVHLMRGDDILENTKSVLARYPIIGFSAMTMDIPIVRKLLALWDKHHPNPALRLSFLGGPIVCDEKILKTLHVDFAVPGEGEESLTALFKNNFEKLLFVFSSKGQFDKNLFKVQWKNKLFSSIPGIIYHDSTSQALISNPSIDPEFNKQAFQNSSGYPKKIKRYSDFQYARIYVECLRGCSNYRRTSLKLYSKNQCSDEVCVVCRGESFTTQLKCPALIPPGCGFCSTIAQFGAVNSRNINSIVKEINDLIRMGAKRIVLGGPDFLDFYRERSSKKALISPTDPEPNYEALETLIDNLLQNPKVRDHEVQLFIENIKASLCTDRALQIISRIPSPIFSIGCETGSSEFADILGRPSDPLVVLDAVRRAIALGIRIHVYFIHSLPGDTPIFAQDTLDLMDKFAQLNIDKITLYRYQELPGSPFYRISRTLPRPPKKLVQTYKKIKRFIIQYNKFQKNKLLGQTIKVYLTELNSLHKSDAIGWMLEGGPKVSVIKGAHLLGTYQTVRIIQVLSDRLVLAELV